jgi:uncharacterized membrane protein YfcA
MLIHLLLWCVAALALAGFVQGTLGFGFGMVSMALLPFAISVKEASPVVVLLTLPAVVIVFCVHWRHCSWRDGWLLVLGTCVGTPLGVYLLKIAPESFLLRGLGAVLLLFALQELWSSWHGKSKLRLPVWSGFPIAMFGGALGGAFNCGGPPVVAYVYSQSWRKEKIVAMLQLIFTVGAALRMISMIQSGLFIPQVLQIGIWSALPVFVTLMIGTRVLKKLPTEKLRTGVFVFVGLIALKFLIWG